ncbi:MAG: alpha/beta hydrolase [Myxococcales bacterium]|nr:alpha/beta hydrolase [Myxococcales bacterium]
MSSHVIDAADGTPLSVRVTGQEGAPVVVLCDGIGCDGYIWKYVQRDFGDRLRFIHPHYRGHGLSALPADDATLTIEQLADDIWHVVDHFEVDNVVLWGHSMGVQVTLEAASRQPGRVRALLPTCGAFERPLDTFHGNSYASQALPWVRSFLLARPDSVRRFWQKAVPTEFSYWLATATEINGRMIRREDFSPYLEHLARMDPLVFTHLLHGVANHSTRRYLADLTMPALIFAGTRDHFTPGSLAAELAGLMPDAELCEIPGGSHTAPLELPDLVTLRAEAFLERIGILS